VFVLEQKIGKIRENSSSNYFSLVARGDASLIHGKDT